MLEKTRKGKAGEGLKKATCFAFLFFIIFISYLSGLNYALSQEQSYEISYAINITILHDNSINEKISIKIRNKANISISELSYELPGNASDVAVYEGMEIANYTLENINGRSVASITLKKPIEKDEEREIIVSFNLANVVEDFGNDKIFSQIFRMPTNAKHFSLQIKLPQGMIIRKEATSETANIAPVADSIATDGESIILKWERENISKFSVFVRFSKPQSREINANAKTGKEAIVLALAIFMLAIFAAALYLRKRGEREEESREKEQEELIHFLKEDEAKVIEIVKSNPGINQKKIAELADYSKSKISKVIAELERRGIVRTEKVGRKVKVYLRENFEKILKEE